MPTQTPNLDLTLPLQTEYYNVGVHNSNNTAIDTAIGNINTNKSDKLTAGSGIVLTKDAVAKTVNVAVDPNLLSNHNTDANAHNGVLIKKLGDTMTGILNLVDPADSNDSNQGATTSWTRRVFGSILQSVLTASGLSFLAQPNGYIKLGNLFGGIILQWGSVAVTSATSFQAKVTFPTAFQSECFAAYATGSGGGDVVSCTGLTTTAINQLYVIDVNAGSGSVDGIAYWFAIGK